MMRALLLVLLVGCTPVGPSPEAQEKAMTLCWEGLLGMERESRPVIEWTPNQSHDNILCPTWWLHDDGNAKISWCGSFLESWGFAFVLVDWRSYLLSSVWPTYQIDKPGWLDDETDKVNEVQRALEKAGY